MFVLALRVYQETGSTTAVAGIYLTFGIPSFLFGIGAGAIVDHFDKRFVLVVADIARGVLTLGFLLATRNVFFIYVFAFLSAIVTQFAVPSEASSIPRLVRVEQLVTANSVFSFTFYSSLVLGSLLAGPLLRFFGPWGIFLFISCVFFLASFSVSKISREMDKRQSFAGITFTSLLGYAQKIIISMREGFSYIRKNPILTDSLLLLTGTQVILGLLATLGPAFADKMLHIDVHDASLVLIGPAVIGIVVGALWVGNAGFKLGPNRLIQWGVTSAGILLICVSVVVHIKNLGTVSLVLPNSVTIPVLLLLFFLLGIANSMLDVPANSILQKEAVGPMRGRVYGMLTSAVGGLGIFPIVISGILADVIGVGKVILILGIVITVYGIYRMKRKNLVSL
jgi:MFS family permease